MPSTRGALTKEKQVSDAIFQAYRGLYSYDKAPLNASVEPYGKPEDDWTAEKITYAAAYGNERAIAYLFLPKRGKPPFQTVVFFPGSNALLTRQFSLYTTSALDAILKSGRAVLYPFTKVLTNAAMAWNPTSPIKPAPGAITSSCGQKMCPVPSTTPRLALN